MSRMKVKVLGAVAAASLALSGCGFNGLYSANLPGGANAGSDPYTVTIEFANVLDLVPQSAVKVNDVAVGKVKSVALDGWKARVKVVVNKKVKLPENARASVKMTSLLGEKYVSLEQPLDVAAPTDLHDGSVIPITRTGTAPEVEEVLGSLSLLLNGGGLEQIRVITTELNKALKGNEQAVHELLDQLNTFVGGLDRQKDKITTALDKIDKLAVTLNRQKQTIADTLDNLPEAIEILKNERTDLVTLLKSLAKLGNVATRVVNASQTHLVSSLKTLSPVLESLTAAGSDIPDAFKIMLTFPFPVGKSLEFAKGDYLNLHLLVNLNLTDNLCGFNKQLCTAAKRISPQTSSNSVRNSTELPVLIGAGR